LNLRILAIDYGTRAAGIAITDELRLTARPLATIRWSGKDRTFLFAEIQRYINTYEVSELVVGLPLSMDGTTGAAAKRVINFVELLRRELGLPIHLIDERLTSKEADDRLRAEGASRTERRSRSDEYAALIILEDFLDRNGMVFTTDHFSVTS